MEELEKEFPELKEGNAELKERLLETERYKSKIKEQEGENLREIIEELLLELLPNREERIADAVEGKRTEPPDHHTVCQETPQGRGLETIQGLRFVQDFTKKDRQAREQLWPQVKQACSSRRTDSDGLEPVTLKLYKIPAVVSNSTLSYSSLLEKTT